MWMCEMPYLQPLLSSERRDTAPRVLSRPILFRQSFHITQTQSTPHCTDFYTFSIQEHRSDEKQKSELNSKALYLYLLETRTERSAATTLPATRKRQGSTL